MENIHTTRKQALATQRDQPYFTAIHESLSDKADAGEIIYPPAPLIFNAFNLTPLDQIKVVILGQDPYHGTGQAHGLSFSVPDGVRPPPSLKNIYKEIVTQLWGEIPTSWNLTHRAEQGVLLLNAFLTVTESQPGSHQKIWRDTFTDSVIQTISDQTEHVVFLLWWKFAQTKEHLIDADKHYILQSPHPSPFSAHKWFFGNGHFKATNEYLESQGEIQIKWIDK